MALVETDSYSIFLDVAADAWSDTVVQEIQLAVSPPEFHVPCVGLAPLIPGGVMVLDRVRFPLCMFAFRVRLATQSSQDCAGKYTVFMHHSEEQSPDNQRDVIQMAQRNGGS